MLKNWTDSLPLQQTCDFFVTFKYKCLSPKICTATLHLLQWSFTVEMFYNPGCSQFSVLQSSVLSRLTNWFDSQSYIFASIKAFHMFDGDTLP